MASRLRLSRSGCSGRGSPSSTGRARATRSTVAPMSASSMATIGAGPRPANSMILGPRSGPLLIRPFPIAPAQRQSGEAALGISLQITQRQRSFRSGGWQSKLNNLNLLAFEFSSPGSSKRNCVIDRLTWMA